MIFLSFLLFGLHLEGSLEGLIYLSLTPLNDDFESAMVIDLICHSPEELLDTK